MRPATPHYVITTDNSVTFGRHFYAASTLAETCFGIIHTIMLDSSVTNASHDATRTLLRRILSNWYFVYCEQSSGMF